MVGTYESGWKFYLQVIYNTLMAFWIILKRSITWCTVMWCFPTKLGVELKETYPLLCRQSCLGHRRVLTALVVTVLHSLSKVIAVTPNTLNTVLYSALGLQIVVNIKSLELETHLLGEKKPSFTVKSFAMCSYKSKSHWCQQNCI